MKIDEKLVPILQMQYNSTVFLHTTAAVFTLFAAGTHWEWYFIVSWIDFEQ